MDHRLGGHTFSWRIAMGMASLLYRLRVGVPGKRRAIASTPLPSAAPAWRSGILLNIACMHCARHPILRTRVFFQRSIGAVQCTPLAKCSLTGLIGAEVYHRRARGKDRPPSATPGPGAVWYQRTPLIEHTRSELGWRDLSPSALLCMPILRRCDAPASSDPAWYLTCAPLACISWGPSEWQHIPTPRRISEEGFRADAERSASPFLAT